MDYHTDYILSHRPRFTSAQTSYLAYRDWAEIDKALVNHKMRRDYLSLVRGLRIVSPNPSEMKDPGLFFRWAVSRGLIITGIFLSPEVLSMIRIPNPFIIHDVEEVILSTPTKNDLQMSHCLSKASLSHLKVLNIDSNDRITCSALKRIILRAPNLQVLSANSCKYIKPKVLNQLPVIAPNLTALYLAKCRFTGYISQELISIVVGLPNLRCLDVSCCDVSYRTVSIILTKRPTLEELYADMIVNSNTRVLLTNETANAAEEFGQSLCDNGRSLRALSLQESVHFTDSHFLPWIERCISLTKFCITNSPYLTDTLLVQLAENCRELRSLDIRNCINFTDIGACAIGNRCQKLRIAFLSSCYQITEVGISSFYRTCPAERVQVIFEQCYRVNISRINRSLLR